MTLVLSLFAVGALFAPEVLAKSDIHAALAGPILLDGACDDAGWSAAKPVDIGGGASLRIAANVDFLYFCIAAPEGSYISTDVYLRASGQPAVNLHASAQLGERGLGETRWTWGNNRGWAANMVEYAGVEMRDGKASGLFRPSRGREFQIARAKFPGDMLDFAIDVNALMTNGEPTGRVLYPAPADLLKPETWSKLRLP